MTDEQQEKLDPIKLSVMKKMKSPEELEAVYEQFVDRNQMNIEYVQKDGAYKIPELDDYEIENIRRVDMMHRLLRKNKVLCEFDPYYSDFKVWKYRYEFRKGDMKVRKLVKGRKVLVEQCVKVYSDYPTEQWIGYNDEERKYYFGGQEESLIESTRFSKVLAYALEWLHNNEEGVK